MLLFKWLRHPPLGVGLIVVAILVAVGLENHHKKAAQRDLTAPPNYQHTASDGGQAGAPPVIVPDSPRADPNPDRQEWRLERDLEVQRDMAKSTELAMYAAFLSLFVTAIGIVLVKQTLDATRDAVVQAERGTKAAEEAVEVTRIAAERQLRAYVHLTAATYEKVEDQRTPFDSVARITIKNYGQTPAYDVTVQSDFDLQEIPLRAKLVRKETKWNPKSTLPPGADLVFFVPLGYPIFEHKMAEIEAGKLAIYLFGEITYKDTFGNEQTTAFRMAYGGRDAVRIGSFASYETGNHAT